MDITYNTLGARYYDADVGQGIPAIFGRQLCLMFELNLELLFKNGRAK